MKRNSENIPNKPAAGDDVAEERKSVSQADPGANAIDATPETHTGKHYQRAILPVEPLAKDPETDEIPIVPNSEVLASLHKVELAVSVDDAHLIDNIGKQHQVDYISSEQVKLHQGIHPLNWIFANPARLIAVSFAMLILLGGVLLSLPVASNAGVWTSFLTSIFTAASAVCVTGLVLVDTAAYWSVFGHVVIITLIQLGGIGLITVVAAFFSLTKKRMNIKTLRAVQDSTASDSVAEVYSLVKRVLMITLSFEIIGGLILSLRYTRYLPAAKAFYIGMFQGVSAFCNAGFDLMGGWTGEYSSLTALNADPIVTMTTTLLLTFGGMGFIVWIDIFNFRKNRKLMFHSKLVIGLTASIILLGTVLFLILEWSNQGSQAMGTLPTWQKPLAALFQAATLRTAGFNTINQANLRDVSKLLSILIMFVGASPVSTGGGMKTTTVAIVLATLRSNVQGKKEAVLARHKISQEIFTRAFVITIMGMMVVMAVSLLLMITERKALADGLYSAIDLVFESMSAVGTVGVTAVQTENISSWGRIPLIFAMYIGRVGPFSFALLLSMRSQKPENVVLPDGLTFIG